MPSTIYFSKNLNQVTPADLIKQLNKKKIPQLALFKKFLEYSYIRTKENEFWTKPVEQINEILLLLWQFIQIRSQNQLEVTLINPSLATEGFELDFTLALIKQKDAPYLVDSLQIALNKLGLEALPIFSIGGLGVVRDQEGHLIDITASNNHPNHYFCFEDPVLIQISKQFDQTRLNKIQKHLIHILQEVHMACDDQNAMRQKVETIIEELENYKHQYASKQTEETITFLKWLLAGHFHFLGYRRYLFNPKLKNPKIDLVSGSGMGLLRSEHHATKTRRLIDLPKEAQRLATKEYILVITKTNTKSDIHRDCYTDYLSIKQFNQQGDIIGEHRFIGLFSHSAYNNSITQIPYIREKTNALLAMTQVPSTGHLGKLVLNILENFPRDDLFQMNIEELYEIISAILTIRERPVTRLIVHKDAYGRFYSCLVYIPREKINTQLSESIANILLTELQGSELSMSMHLDDSIVGRLHYMVRIAPTARDQSKIDFNHIENMMIENSKTWDEKLHDLLIQRNSALIAAKLYQQFKKSFSLSYQEDFSPEEALDDIQYIQNVQQTSSIELKLSLSKQNLLSFKLFQIDQPTTLSEIIPILEHMGLETIEENAYKCILAGKITWICNYKIRIRDNDRPNLEQISPLFHDLFFAVWQKRVENDPLNALVLKCEIPARSVSVLRAYCSYLKFIGVYSQAYLIQVLNNNFHISKQLLELFHYRFDPTQNYEIEIVTLKKMIQKNLIAVRNLEEDKILRSLLALIEATIRTNYFQQDDQGQCKNYLSFKLQSHKIPNLPLPYPLYEIFVYSVRFEALHLRATKVARGGIRWSDRLEDLRTEVLGLMKAQQVKNAVIVPGGSKGGFVLKNILNNTDRNTIIDEAIVCYKNFMRGLLDLTDNFINETIIPPKQTKIYDEADPYLVVAADKGTASFSDYANEISAEYHFWLGDAFASGGSHGYDHKKMAITAKGAWISVENHLKTLAINPSADPFTVIGIGDMSGDVFGNGMLLSNKIKLVGAFNHLHIFIDPNPDCTSSFAERKRLFQLPRSNWTDYNRALISAGGGVFERSAKSITLTKEIKDLFALTENTIEPNALIRMLLTAQVDLLFNGGIGTYVKSSKEHHNDVGDKTNNELRVNATELRCKAVGEGGNLGFTQLARVEFAQQGGLIFTDFIDNSAGVDLSDHEVNIKILLNPALTQQLIQFNQRNQLLETMTAAVQTLVLKDNLDQTEALSYAATQSVNELEIYARCIHQFEHDGILNRNVEFLPTEHQLEERRKSNQGLTAPEIAIIMAYVKIDIKQALLKSNIPDTEYFQTLINNEFPDLLNQQYHQLMSHHQLRREIISTQLTNQLINQAGILFVQRLREETNASIAQIIRAYMISIKIFELEKFYTEIRELDFQVSQSIQTYMRKLLIRFLRRATRWLLRHQLPDVPMTETLLQLRGIQTISGKLTQFLGEQGLKSYQQLINHCTEANVPIEIATKLAQTYYGYLLLEINALAQKKGVAAHKVAKLYFKLGKILKLDWLRDEITNSLVNTQWESLAHSSLRDQLDYLQSKIVELGLTHMDELEQWLQSSLAEYYEAWQNMISQLRLANKTDYVMYSVVLNSLRQLITQLEQ